MSEHSSSDTSHKEVVTDIGRTATGQGLCKTQLSLAQLAIKEGRVKLAENGYGAWIVMGNDGVTPCAVKLFPKETCSCPSSKSCYYIMAYRMMIGLLPNDSAKANLAETFRRNRKTQERSSGRKKPHKRDFKVTKTEERDTVAGL